MIKKKSLWCLVVLAFLIQAAVVQAPPATTVSVNPSYSNLNLGDPLTVTVNISTTEEMYAFDVSVYYDPAILNATGTTQGGFLNQGGASTSYPFGVAIDNTNGVVTVPNSRLGAVGGATGSGILFTINFDTIGAGTSQTGMDNVQLLDTGLNVLAYTANNGSAKVNTPPAIQSVVVSPDPAYTPDALDCGFLVTDPDALDTVKVNVTWLKNGAPWHEDDENGIAIASWGNTSAQGDIEPGDTVKGDTWVCRVTAYDELSQVSQDSAQIAIQNSLPTQPAADLTPDSPYTVDDLLCFITTPSTDADLDPITYSYAWYRDGVLQPAETTVTTGLSDTVSSSKTGRDEVWGCNVTPNDGDANGTGSFDQVTVLNSKPVADSVSLTPASPVTSDNLAANYGYSDDDLDPEAGTEIRWYRNGVMQPAYNDQLTVPSSATAKGETWYFTVKPGDGTEFGGLKTSDNVTVRNSPSELEPIGDKAVLETNTLEFNLSAADNDTDSLTYGTNASFGTFNANTGEFSWATGWYDAGVYTVIFNVTDGTVVVQEMITITVNNNNRIPSIDSYTPLALLMNTRTGRALSFTHTSSDQDADDTLSYSWRVNGTQRAASQNWDFNPDPQLSDCGDREVEIVVNDSHDAVSQSWNVHVNLSGDVDLDGEVDIVDLASVGLAYGSQPGDGNWNANADLYTLPTEGGPEGDGKINIFDLATVGLNYGRRC